MRSKIHSYLGFAKRSRNLLSGYNSCIFGMERGKVKLLLLAEDLAENSKKKCLKTAEINAVETRIYGTKEILSTMTGEEDRGVFGITEKQMADVIINEIDKEQSESSMELEKE